MVDHCHVDPERRCGECVQRSCDCKCYQSKFTRGILRAPAARSVAELVGDVEVQPGQAERIFEKASRRRP